MTTIALDEIGPLCGMSAKIGYQWMKNPGAPKPVGYEIRRKENNSKARLYNRAEVDDYLKRTGKLNKKPRTVVQPKRKPILHVETKRTLNDDIIRFLSAPSELRPRMAVSGGTTVTVRTEGEWG